ncbi:uroporphyrinogen-III C-methyltransferase [Olivibacter sp. CPCC 100613]|uniref:uroporphyrinogen-III C-methyltransferase n=1 Tax=Olivibacter sp. CPCC 100613 TaxID=3079931 RepID=UPI002FF56F48
MKEPKITLVGAGPGDPELLSLAGVEALGNADVVLYDALVDPAILVYAKKGSEKIFVGKRAGCHAYGQESINKMLVHFAHSYGHVVRLKGGDPYIFGRGSEELQYAKSKNIETVVVPGVSSSMAVAELAGISLIDKNLSADFWVITGSTKEGDMSRDLYLAAKLDQTVVILMGTQHIEKIVDLYKKESKGKMPIAIVQNGSLRTQRTLFATIDTIQHEIAEKGLLTPAIIVVGKTLNT